MVRTCTGAAGGAMLMSVVVPTSNEAGNIGSLLARLTAASVQRMDPGSAEPRTMGHETAAEKAGGAADQHARHRAPPARR